MRKILEKEMTIQNVTLTEAGEFENDLLPFSLVQANTQDIHPRYSLHLAKRTTICSLRISKYVSSYLREGHKIHCMFHAANALKFFC
jgi:FlaA1/EpsC-like NDP-sugar epimerase